MYTITFYSYKGGVGRSMALLNVAFNLAKQSRSVLIVDFDLEAPGLDAFLKPYNARQFRGIVDFVTDYRTTGQSPDAHDYVYEIGTGTTPKLWYTPAGRRDLGYGGRLHSINWKHLYEKEDGYLLFEDLKAQWRTFLQPDYVLIDSRTGHTDVSGICTRQLPDAVVMLFRLDAQNLDGLTKVVEDVRKEADGPRQKHITLHFVPSNVPNMDDEEDILEQQMERFRKQLNFRELTAVIHHYEDLDMLRHRIFAVERSKTRIAKEYAALAAQLVKYNIEDIEGARDYLKDLLRRPKRIRAESASNLESRIAGIAKAHHHDPTIVRLLADLRERQGKLDQALAYLTETIDSEAPNSDLLIRRAELHKTVRNKDQAKADLIAALKLPATDYFSVLRIINLIRDINPEALQDIGLSTAVRSLQPSDRIVIGFDLLSNDKAEETLAAEQIADELLGDSTSIKTLESSARAMLTLLLIGTRKFRSAIDILSPPESIADHFNLAIAQWGDTGIVPIRQFSAVVTLDQEEQSRERDANYDLCLAIAFSAIGDIPKAKDRLRSARQKVTAEIGRVFSPWRYRRLNVSEFLIDIETAEKQLPRGILRPHILERETLTGG